MVNVSPIASMMGLLLRTGKSLDRASDEMQGLSSTIVDFMAFDWEDRDFRPLDPNDPDDLAYIRLVADVAFPEDKALITHDGDVLTKADFELILKQYTGDEQQIFNISGYEYTMPEIFETFATSYQTSSILAYSTINAAKGTFSISALQAYIRSSFTAMTAQAAIITGIISENFDPNHPFDSMVQIVRIVTNKMGGGTIDENGSIDFDQTDYSITSIWAAIPTISLWHTAAEIIAGIASFISIGFGAIISGASALFSLIKAAFDVPNAAINTESSAFPFYSVACVQHTMNQIDAPLLDARIGDEGAKLFESSLGFLKTWRDALSDGEPAQTINVEMNPSLSGGVLAINYVDQTDSALSIDTRDYEAGVDPRLLNGLLLNVTRSIDNTDEFNPIEKYSFSLVMRQDLGEELIIELSNNGTTLNEHVHTFHPNLGRPLTDKEYACIAASSILMNELLFAFSESSVSLPALLSTEMAEKLAPTVFSTLVSPTFVVDMPLGAPNSNIQDLVAFEFNRDPIAYPIDFTHSAISTLIYAFVNINAVGDSDAWNHIKLSALRMRNYFSDSTALMATNQVINTSYGAIPEAYIPFVQYAPLVRASTSEDYQTAARNLVIVAGAVIAASAALVVKRSIMKRRIAKSALLQRKVDAANASYVDNPSKENYKLVTKTNIKQNRFFARTGYLSGTNWGAGSASGFPNPFEANDNLSTLISGA